MIWISYVLFDLLVLLAQEPGELADITQMPRQTCLSHLDCCRFLTVPGLIPVLSLFSNKLRGRSNFENANPASQKYLNMVTTHRAPFLKSLMLLFKCQDILNWQFLKPLGPLLPLAQIFFVWNRLLSFFPLWVFTQNVGRQTFPDKVLSSRYN